MTPHLPAVESASAKTKLSHFGVIAFSGSQGTGLFYAPETPPSCALTEDLKLVFQGNVGIRQALRCVPEVL